MPAKYLCMASRPPAGEINSYIDSATDEADAIRQFREIHRLDRWEANHPDHGPVQVEAKVIEEIPGSANKMATEVADLPESAQEAISKAAEAPAVPPPAVEAPPPPPSFPPELEELRAFGLSDRHWLR